MVLAVEADRTQSWRVNSMFRRTDGPSVIRADGTQEWIVNGLWHRTDGPAVIRADGTQLWYVNGQNLTKKITSWMQQRDIKWPWNESAHMEFVLTWL
jgi:hypothetical protein